MELLSGSSPAVKSVIEKTLKEWEKNDEIVILSTIPETLVNSMFQAIIAVAPNPTKDSLNQAELKVTLELNNSELNLFRSALRELTRLCTPMQFKTLTGWTSDEVNVFFNKLTTIAEDTNMSW